MRCIRTPGKGLEVLAADVAGSGRSTALPVALKETIVGVATGSTFAKTAKRISHNVLITGAGRSGVLLPNACVDNVSTQASLPSGLDKAVKAYMPPCGVAGNPVGITGGEPRSTYRNTIKLRLDDERIHVLIFGCWHTIVTPPMVFAELVSEVVEEGRQRGIHKPVVVLLSGDVEVEEASDYLFQHGVLAYPIPMEKLFAVLGARYRWARAAGLTNV